MGSARDGLARRARRSSFSLSATACARAVAHESWSSGRYMLRAYCITGAAGASADIQPTSASKRLLHPGRRSEGHRCDCDSLPMPRDAVTGRTLPLVDSFVNLAMNLA